MSINATQTRHIAAGTLRAGITAREQEVGRLVDGLTTITNHAQRLSFRSRIDRLLDDICQGATALALLDAEIAAAEKVATR